MEYNTSQARASDRSNTSGFPAFLAQFGIEVAWTGISIVATLTLFILACKYVASGLLNRARPAEQPVEQPFQQPVERPAQRRIEQPVEQSVEEPVEQHVGRNEPLRAPPYNLRSRRAQPRELAPDGACPEERGRKCGLYMKNDRHGCVKSARASAPSNAYECTLKKRNKTAVEVCFKMVPRTEE